MSKQTELAQVADTITVDSGNVGIGTTADQQASSTNEGIWLASGVTSSFSANSVPLTINRMGTGGNNRINIDLRNNGTSRAELGSLGASNGMYVAIGGSEVMRIDSSGNLLVGTTNASLGTGGIQLNASGRIGAAASSLSPMVLNRQTSDGTIVDLRKDGATVGSIGNLGTTLFIQTSGDQAGLGFYSGHVSPRKNNAASDNAIDLGRSSQRYDDIFATNGTINTSDRNEKQDIAELTDAEQRVAVAAKGLLRKFRWQDAVAEKGDDARIHFGIIAQDLQDAFAAEGLDAGRYAMFISSTWWETQTEVPAVEAVAGVLDDDGNVVTEAVEAKDAYTRTDTYETLEEAPEGATERTRLGVRYPELLAFIIGAM